MLNPSHGPAPYKGEYVAPYIGAVGWTPDHSWYRGIGSLQYKIFLALFLTNLYFLNHFSVLSEKKKT